MPTGPSQWPPLDEDAHIIWPLDLDERVQLARKLFNRVLVETMDNYLDHAVDVVNNPRPAKPYETENWLSGVDRAYRQVFSSLNAKQKEIVLRLVRDVVEGVLLQALIRLDQFYIAEVKIALAGKGPDGQAIDVPVTSVEAELAEQFVQSTEELSKYATQLADDLKSPPQL